MLAQLDMPFGYYRLLRWIVAPASLFLALEERQRGRHGWVWVLVMQALLFNPIVPVALDRGTWRLVDAAAALLLLASTRGTTTPRPLGSADGTWSDEAGRGKDGGA